MAHGMTSTKRFVVRTAMVTGTTLATIFGSQSLAAFDQANSVASAEPFNSDLNNTALVIPAGSTSVDALAVAPSIVFLRHESETSVDIPAVAPRITILRHEGETTVAAPAPASAPAQTVPQQTQITPPNPVQVVPAQPSVQSVGAPQVPSTQSSRR